MSMGEVRVFNEVITPYARPVVHRVSLLIQNLVALRDYSAAHRIGAALSLSLSRSSHLSQRTRTHAGLNSGLSRERCCY